MKQQHRKKLQFNFRFQSKCLELKIKFKRKPRSNYYLKRILLSLWLFLVKYV